MSRKQWILPAAAALLCLCALLAAGCRDHRAEDRPLTMQTEETPPAQAEAAVPLPGVSGLTFERCSAGELLLRWPTTLDAQTERYRICRRTLPDGRWECLSEQPAEGGDHQYHDVLHSDVPQQFLYRIDAVLRDGATTEGEPIPASNLLVCLDPGHYLNSSTLSGEELYGYGEGLFMLQLGLTLRQTLLTQYGVSCVMTRESDEITIQGYTDADLDLHHLSLRGEFAAGSDLFLSLHTNANLDNANGYPTCNQPIAINKTIVFVNQTALQSESALRLADAIGQAVSEANYSLGLSASDQFRKTRGGQPSEWSDAFNDALDTPGAVCFRPGEKGDDYYGVLRGAAKVGVPGLIIEHGFHTSAAVRQAAMQGDLAQIWASADAKGIADAYGFVSAQTLS